MKTLTYWTNFGERRCVYLAEDGCYSLEPDQKEGYYFFREELNSVRVIYKSGEGNIDVGELTANSKELLNV